MKVAIRISLLTALFAAIGIVAACVMIFTVYRSSTLDVQLGVAEESYISWSTALREQAAKAELYQGGSSWLEDAALRYYAEQIHGSDEFAVYSDDTVVFNNTGVDALRFIRTSGRAIPFGNNLLYGYVKNEGNVQLVVGSAAQSTEFEIYLVRNIESVWQEIDSLGEWCVIAGCTAVAVCAACIFIAVRRMLRPLEGVRDAMSAVASGRYDEHIRVQPGNDEFAQLTADCKTMSVAIKDKVEQLGHVAEERRLLLSAVAHEMRTPVAAIAGLAGTVQSLALSEERRMTLLNMIREESMRLERLCTKLTVLLSANAVDLKPISAVDFASDIRNEARAASGTAALTVDVETEARWLADADLLQMAVINLIDNARKADASDIRLALGADSIAVSDDGCGIPESVHNDILKPFVKGDSSRSTEGFGLGLALVDRIAAAHGARILIESWPGHGTRVVIEMPPLSTGAF